MRRFEAIEGPEKRASSEILLATPEGLQASVDVQGGYLGALKDPAGNDLLFERRIIGVRERGGAPVCAPIFGPGEIVGLKQHGFARNLQWEILDFDEDAPNSVSMELMNPRKQDPAIPENYAGCELTLAITLASVDSASILNMNLAVSNAGTEPFVAAPAFHPYFQLEKKTAEHVRISKDGYTLQFPAEQLSATEYLMPQKDQAGQVSFDTGRHLVTIEAPSLPVTALWTEMPQQNGYLCVEPTAAGPLPGKTSSQIDKLLLKPSENRAYTMTITWKESLQ